MKVKTSKQKKKKTEGKSPASPKCGPVACQKTSPEKNGETRIQSPYNRCPLYGAALVAAEVFDPEFSIHGPQGCVAAIVEAFSLQKKEVEFQTSSMSKNDIVFGGEKTLYEAVADAFTPYEKAGPKFVVTTCSSEIIGDNVKNVTAKFNPGLPAVVVAGGGVNGDHYKGINNALSALVLRFAEKQPQKIPSLVNLIGNIGQSRQWKGDYYEMVRLLNALGLEVNRLGCDCTIEEYRKASSAALTILITPEIGLDAAKYLADEFGVPYFSSSFFLPLGLRGTETWLRELETRLELKKGEIDTLVEQEEVRVRSALKVGLYQMTYIEKLVNLKHMPTAIIAEGPVAFSWARFISEELNMRPVFLGTRTGFRDKELQAQLDAWKQESSLSPDIAEAATYEDVEAAIEKAKPEFIMGSSVEQEVGRKEGVSRFLHIANPNTTYITVTDHPFLGYNGVINATESIVNLMS